MKKKLIIAALVGASAISLASCGKSKSSDTISKPSFSSFGDEITYNEFLYAYNEMYFTSRTDEVDKEYIISRHNEDRDGNESSIMDYKVDAKYDKESNITAAKTYSRMVQKDSNQTLELKTSNNCRYEFEDEVFYTFDLDTKLYNEDSSYRIYGLFNQSPQIAADITDSDAKYYKKGNMYSFKLEKHSVNTFDEEYTLSYTAQFTYDENGFKLSFISEEIYGPSEDNCYEKSWATMEFSLKSISFKPQDKSKYTIGDTSAGSVM